MVHALREDVPVHRLVAPSRAVGAHAGQAVGAAPPAQPHLARLLRLGSQ